MVQEICTADKHRLRLSHWLGAMPCVPVRCCLLALGPLAGKDSWQIHQGSNSLSTADHSQPGFLVAISSVCNLLWALFRFVSCYSCCRTVAILPRPHMPCWAMLALPMLVQPLRAGERSSKASTSKHYCSRLVLNYLAPIVLLLVIYSLFFET